MSCSQLEHSLTLCAEQTLGAVSVSKCSTAYGLWVATPARRKVAWQHTWQRWLSCWRMRSCWTACAITWSRLQLAELPLIVLYSCQVTCLSDRCRGLQSPTRRRAAWQRMSQP